MLATQTGTTRFHTALLALLAACAGLPATAQQANGQRLTNIIPVAADDLGYGNLACYNPGSKIPTPHIDSLAQQGTRFTRFYAGNTVCAPSWPGCTIPGAGTGIAGIDARSCQPLRQLEV